MVGDRKIELTKTNILQRVSEYDIFRRYLGIDFKIGETFCNPLRGEKKESSIIRMVRGKLTLKDYGDSKFDGDCFDVVSAVHNKCSFMECLAIVDRDFNLGISTNKIENKPTIITWEQPKIIKEVIAPKFKVITRAPTKEELRYWSNHYVGLQDLKKDDVYFPKEIYRNGSKIPLSPYLTFCYWYEDEKVWKIYRPHGETGKMVWYQKRKWDSGLRFDYVEKLENIQNCYNAFLATSKKDRLVTQNILQTDCICNVQGEDISAINDDSMSHIISNSRVQYCLGDRDKAGKEFSWYLTNEFNFRHINPPEDRPKDFADWVRDFGPDELDKHFKKKIVKI